MVLGRGFVFSTTDGGVTWEVAARVAGIGDGKRVASAVIGPENGRLYVGVLQQGRGTVYVTDGPASAGLGFVVSEASGAPEPSELGVRVVPNPSAGGAVRVELAGEGTLRARVVDAVGRTVAELWAGELRGERSVELDTSGWAAGVYTVVVEAEGARRAEAFTVAR